MTISPSELSAILGVAEQLAIHAGAEILEVRQRGCVTNAKADGSPVTEADQRGERVIVEGLAKHFPSVPIVAEEMAAAGLAPSALGPAFFLVDALDGTKEFCFGRDEFTVNIALVENGVPVLGVVSSPALRLIYSGFHGAKAGSQATRASLSASGGVEKRERMSARERHDPLTILATRSHMNDETGAFLNQHPGALTRSIGSSLKFCLLASGQADLYPRFGTTMGWDTAAGDAILRAAGGATETLDGKPLTYGRRGQKGMADFQNPFFVARGR